MVWVPKVAVPIQTTEPLGFDGVPALMNDSINASPLFEPNDPVPHVITVATGNI